MIETKVDSRRESEHFMPPNASAWQKQHPYEPSPTAHPQPVPLVSPADLVNPMLTVGDICQKGVRVCDPKLPLMEAIEMVSEAESGMLPVVRGGKPVGILTERDVVGAVAHSPSAFFRQTVEAVMCRQFAVVRDDATLDKLFDCFGNRGTLVVDRHGKLVGIVYWRCLANRFSERALGRVLAKTLQRSSDHGQQRRRKS